MSDFDLASAQPIQPPQFDLASAQPVSAQDSTAASPASPPQLSSFDNFLRQVALGDRAAAQGVMSTLTLPDTIANWEFNKLGALSNRVLGTNFDENSPNLSQQFSQALTDAGAYTPQTAGEQLSSAVNQGVTGALTGGGLTGLAGGANAARAAISGATSSGASETARQAGLPSWMQVGAGVVGGMTPMFLESTGRLAGNIIAPVVSQTARDRIVGDYLNDQATDPQAAAMAMQVASNRPPLVPGSPPTAAEASGDLGLLSVEKQARGISPEDFALLASDRNLARQTELTRLGGTPRDIERATQARAATADTLYGNAAGDSAPIDNEMTALMQRPAMQEAIGKAMQIAGNRGQSFGLASTMPGLPMSLTGSDLQALKQTLTDMRDSQFRAGNTNMGYAIAGTLNDLKDWTLRNVPSARLADNAFQAASQPINRMQSIQDLQNQATIPQADLRTGQYFLSAPRYSNALDSLQSEPLNAVDGGSMARLEAIRKDLANAGAINNLRAPSSDTFQNFMLGERLKGFIGAKAGLPWLYKKAGTVDKLNDQLVDAMLSPSKAATLMQAPPQAPFNYGLGAYDVGTFFGLPGMRPESATLPTR
jgi:hypothetical protein